MLQRCFILLMFVGATTRSPSSLEPMQAQAQSPAPDFSSYPQTESFRFYLRGQTNAAEHLQRANLLAISAFPSGDRFALQYVVTETGRESDHRYVYNFAIQASHERQLSEAELNNLRSAIHELLVESKSPPVERLVIVSFREGTNWVTRSYDSDALPKSMRQHCRWHPEPQRRCSCGIPHLPTSNHINPSAITGVAAVTLSMRSNMPP